MSENVWGSCQRNGADPYVFYLLLFNKIEMSYKNRLIRIKISHAPLAANAALRMACAIYKTKKYLLIVSKLPSGDIFLPCAWLIL